MVNRPELLVERSLFLEGPAGAGKTFTAANYLKSVILDNGVKPTSALILVPQPHLGDAYRSVFHALDIESFPTITTHSAFARRMLQRFWSAVSQAHPLLPDRDPIFLNFEMAQHFMGQFARPLLQTGSFDSLSLPDHRLIAQVLDNLNKATLAGLTIDEAEDRLRSALGTELKTSREAVHSVSAQIAKTYRKFCLQAGLLDYAVQIELFDHYLLDNADFEAYFSRNFSHLVADNIEEMGALAHDFIEWCLPRVDKAILVYDHDGGYRVFLGADPENAYALGKICETRRILDAPPFEALPDTQILIQIVRELLTHGDDTDLPEHDQNTAVDNGLRLIHTSYYPDMLRQCGLAIYDLIENKQALPAQIVVIAPYVSDSLRFMMTSTLAELDIASHVTRPSRPIIAEPAIRALLPLIAIVYAEYLPAPLPDHLATSFSTLIDGLDPARANLLVQIVYRNGLSSWTEITASMQERITEDAGQRYEYLRVWLAQIPVTSPPPLDHFLSGLYGDVLTRPGYGFYHNADADRAVNHLIQLAQQHRETLHLVDAQNRRDSTGDLLELLTNGLLAAHDDVPQAPNAVLIMPTHTYLNQNRIMDYQVWLDIGHSGWSKRLEQPLTHPYVLRRNYSSNRVWTDDDEQRIEEEMLHNLVLGLLRRCRKGVFVGFCDLNEMGYEQQGPLAALLQQLLITGI